MEFPERSPREVEVRAVQKRHLFGPQASVIEGSEHRIVPGGGSVLAGGGDPGLEEVEELRNLLWGRRRQLGRRVIATAILDRLLHHCDVVSLHGPSYWLKNRLAAIERDTNVA
ncbi:ATP-binding protein [Streptomyces sp. NPDC055912]|uniref:ATP-binding protein n=1 Tax=Streptomyces sp. NPDC055912 TaxID=3345660 RepID=UPI0035D8E6B7